MRLISILILIWSIGFSNSCAPKHSPNNFSDVRLEVVQLEPEPIIKAGDPVTEDDKFGFEGGTCRKVNGVYCLFTTEVFDEPKTSFMPDWRNRLEGLRINGYGNLISIRCRWIRSLSKIRLLPRWLLIYTPTFMMEPISRRYLFSGRKMVSIGARSN